jgi:hypothetical protein
MTGNIVKEVNNKYSTSEIATGERWVDGRMIYRKSYETGALKNAGKIEINSGLTNVNVLRMYGYVKRTSYPPYTLNLPHMSISSGIIVQYNDGASVIEIYTIDDRTAFSGYITLEYTKL